MRARAQHAKAVWTLLHPLGTGVPHGNPLVYDAGTNADALAAPHVPQHREHAVVERQYCPDVFVRLSVGISV